MATQASKATRLFGFLGEACRWLNAVGFAVSIATIAIEFFHGQEQSVRETLPQRIDQLTCCLQEGPANRRNSSIASRSLDRLLPQPGGRLYESAAYEREIVYTRLEKGQANYN